MPQSNDFLAPAARGVLNALGNAPGSAMIEWWALNGRGEPVAPASADSDDVNPCAFIAVWQDETASRVTVEPTADPGSLNPQD